MIIHTTVTESIVQALEDESIPWRQPWISEISANAINKRPSLHKGDAFLSTEAGMCIPNSTLSPLPKL